VPGKVNEELLQHLARIGAGGLAAGVVQAIGLELRLPSLGEGRDGQLLAFKRRPKTSPTPTLPQRQGGLPEGVCIFCNGQLKKSGFGSLLQQNIEKSGKFTALFSIWIFLALAGPLLLFT
jgi:hypothetical protein